MKQLKPTNLIAVEVPENIIWDANFPTHFTYLDTEIGKVTEPIYMPIFDDRNSIRYFIAHNKILGEVTKEGVQFDVEPFVEFINGINDIGFRNYQIITMCDTFKTPQESFQSLLQANNVEIPEGKKLLILLKQ